MRLNFECVRDILLCVEENTDVQRVCVFVDVSEDADSIRAALGYPRSNYEVQPYHAELLSRYNNDILIYHIRYCIEAGLIKESPLFTPPSYGVSDLTVDGHELIGKVRDPKHWEQTQRGMSKIGMYSLSVLRTIAEGLASGAASAFCQKLFSD